MELKLEFIQIPDGEVIAGRQHSVPSSGMTLGRSASCGIHLPDNRRLVSATHGRIYGEQGQWFIEDSSTNGVFINQNDQPLGRGNRFLLSDGDVLKCGDYQLLVNLFQLSGPADAAWNHGLDTTAPPPEVDPFQPQAVAKTTEWNDPFAEPVAAEDTLASAEFELLRPDTAVPGGAQSFAAPDEHGRTEPLIDVLDAPDDPQEHDFSPQLLSAPAMSSEPEPLSAPDQIDLLRDGVLHDPDAAMPMPPEQVVQQNQLIQQLVEDNQRLRHEIELQQSHQEKLVYKCMGEALEQTLMDLSPSALEQLFDDYTGRRWWRKRDNWQLYGRHFKRMMSEQTYKLTFMARFRKALERYQEDH